MAALVAAEFESRRCPVKPTKTGEAGIAPERGNAAAVGDGKAAGLRGGGCGQGADETRCGLAFDQVVEGLCVEVERAV